MADFEKAFGDYIDRRERLVFYGKDSVQSGMACGGWESSSAAKGYRVNQTTQNDSV